jgi:hypothetical protein
MFARFEQCKSEIVVVGYGVGIPGGGEVSDLKVVWPEVVMFVGISAICVGGAVAMLWLVLCRVWGNAFEPIADQGDDWSPFPWSGKPDRTSIWVIPQRNPMIEIIVDRSRPAWHSAVGVELACREVGPPARRIHEVG